GVILHTSSSPAKAGVVGWAKPAEAVGEGRRAHHFQIKQIGGHGRLRSATAALAHPTSRVRGYDASGKMESKNKCEYAAVGADVEAILGGNHTLVGTHARDRIARE